jgi:hypothetical protein
MKTSELTGAALDWAVAKCEPDDTLATYFDESTGEPLCHDDWPNNQEYKPSTDWADGGPVIEREQMWIHPLVDVDTWTAFNVNARANGPTPLIAAMRCYVTSKLGDDVDIPQELL